MAEMVYVIASGEKIDMDRTKRFGVQLDEVYANPFEKKQQKPTSAAEIKNYMLDKIAKLRKKLTRKE